jgi:hypothetical protein
VDEIVLNGDVQITIINSLVQEEKQCRLQYEQEALLFLEPIHLQLIQCSRRSITHSSICEYNTQFAIIILAEESKCKFTFPTNVLKRRIPCVSTPA